MADSVMPTYNRLPVTFARGNGVWLEDDKGQRYLDALAGIAVCNLGHAHPRITATIQQQSAQLLHTSNVYGVEHQQRLANRLTALTGMERVFFANSGAEANECAIKIARRVGYLRGIKTPSIIVMEGAFHGRTMATMTATGNTKVKEGFGSLVEGFYRVPFNDIDAVRELAAVHKDIIAVLVEPIQGEGGVVAAEKGYLKALREVCDQQDWLLMLDEIQTGVGRTGHWYAFQGEDVLPHVVTSAKGLGNGIPIGACMARGVAAEALGPGSHGSTFGGNPFCTAVASAVLDTIEQDNILDHVQTTGAYLLTELSHQLQHTAGVQGICGRGLMIGITLDRPCGELVEQCLAKGLLINVTAGNTVRLLPPLIISQDEVDLLLGILVPQIQTFLAA